MSVTWIQTDGAYEVSSKEHLLQVMTQGTLYSDAGTPPSDYWPSAYVQTADIDLGADTNIASVGTETAPFSGSYDGQGYSLSNWSLVGSSDVGVGMFGVMNGATVENLVMDGVWTLTGIDAGLLAGQAVSSSAVRNITTDFSPGSSVSGTSGDHGASTLISYGDSSTFENLSVGGTVDSLQSLGPCGGIIAWCDACTIGYVRNIATFTGGMDGPKKCGGVIGSATNSTVEYAVNAMIGDISGDTHVGGVVGTLLMDSSNTVDALANSMTGNITSGTSSNAGGILGSGDTIGKALKVRVDLDTGEPLSLSEVQVYTADGTNVALSGSAEQSTTAYDASASRAIDGGTSGLFRTNTITHTDPTESTAWWQVTLDDEYEVDYVRVWNRAEGGSAARLIGAVLSVLDASDNVLATKTLGSARTHDLYASTNSSTGEVTRAMNYMRGNVESGIVGTTSVSSGIGSISNSIIAMNGTVTSADKGSGASGTMTAMLDASFGLVYSTSANSSTDYTLTGFQTHQDFTDLPYVPMGDWEVIFPNVKGKSAYSQFDYVVVCSGSLSFPVEVEVDAPDQEFVYRINTGDSKQVYTDTSVTVLSSDATVYDTATGAAFFMDGLSSAVYSYRAQLTWPGYAGASSYRVTMSEDGSSEQTCADGLMSVSHTQKVTPGSAYDFTVYSDNSASAIYLFKGLVIPAVDDSSATGLLSLLGNDMTSLTSEEMATLSSSLLTSLTTNDTIKAYVTYGGGKSAMSLSFVSLDDVVEVPKAKNVLLPFTLGGGDSQQVDLQLADGSTSIITYDEASGTISVSGVSYDVGSAFYLDDRRVRVQEMA